MTLKLLDFIRSRINGNICVTFTNCVINNPQLLGESAGDFLLYYRKIASPLFNTPNPFQFPTQLPTMVQTVQAKDINLRYLINNFGLQLVQDDQFFLEWQENLPEITDLDKLLLDKVKAGYFNLLNYPPLLEDVVRMAILDPILFIGDFYLAPFYVKSEEPVDIAVEDEGVIIKGRIDTLVLKDQFWVMVIESKKAAFSIEEGLAQILVYLG